MGMKAIVAMCGDGANDCGALKAAHVVRGGVVRARARAMRVRSPALCVTLPLPSVQGLSLSQAEASIAAPFTSAEPNISAAVELIRQGRCALMTSVQCFKYMVVYSMLQFFAVSILYNFNSNYADLMYLWIDMFLVFPLAIVMARTEPYATLHPGQPPTKLLSLPIFLSVFGLMAIQLAAMLAAYFWLTTQSWFVPLHPDPHSLNFLCFETTTIFLVNMFQYISVCIAYNMSYRFRRVWVTNLWLLIGLIVLTALCGIMLMWPLPFLQQYIFIYMALPMDFRWQLLLFIVGNGAVTIAFEYVLLGCGCARAMGAACSRCCCRPCRRRRGAGDVVVASVAGSINASPKASIRSFGELRVPLPHGPTLA